MVQWVTGAGKTTLLDILAGRSTIGLVSGEVYINGQLRDTSFQRMIGYVQQDDIHLPTTTVREALQFNGLLRQEATKSKGQKLAYVERILTMMEMESHADAIVGVPGEGLNVEQRKRLTIAVEMAAQLELVLFLGTYTSQKLSSQLSVPTQLSRIWMSRHQVWTVRRLGLFAGYSVSWLLDFIKILQVSQSNQIGGVVFISKETDIRVYSCRRIGIVVPLLTAALLTP